ncbi:MAG: PD-(D/E)XK nuclease family protein [Nitrososphaerota archaeon]|jgi:putative RecB family exonuclease|nr:PD-(D/E)XK nuclease family protein [Nitrososphaerota archaeon]
MEEPELVPLRSTSLTPGLKPIPPRENRFPPPKRRYSVTADILSYRRCKRQYGFFSRRGYVSAQSGQLFFGTVIHQTLDKAHAHFRGEIEGTHPGSIPTENDINGYFEKAAGALEAQGVHRMSNESRDKALAYVQEFNRSFGPEVYPRIIDTEHRLQKDKGTYILHGIVDVVAAPEGASGWDGYEIWDYKGAKRPKRTDDGDRDMKNYEFQMRVYAHLYELRNGVRPKRAILWFLGERRREHQQHAVDLSDTSITTAVGAFEETVEAIESSIRSDDWSSISVANAPSIETCNACDLRWNCSAREGKYDLKSRVL